MKFWLALLLAFCCLHSLTVTAQSARKRFIYGVAGHPLTQEAYKKNLDLQIRLLNQLRTPIYRVDVPVRLSGAVVNPDEFLAMLVLMRKKGIKVLPVLVFTQEAYAERSTEKAYADGLAYGRTFANRYSRYFDHYEVGNEEDSQTIVGAQVHGNLPEHFNTPKANVIIPFFKGVCQGIRQADKSAMLIINFAWVHYGFLQRLVQAGVSFDRIGCHWYSDMGEITKANAGFGNVIDTLYRQFKKRIWVTELNVRGVPTAADASKEGWFNRHLTYLRKSRYVDAVFIYELLDQPAFAEARAGGSYNPGEATFGLGAWQRKYASVKEKPLFNQYSTFIRRHP